MKPAIACLALLAAVGCSDSTDPDAGPCTASTGSVDATVTHTAQGTVIDWKPACAVAMVLVEEDASDMWFAIAPGMDANATEAANIIVPPVIYGQLPPGAEEGEPPLPLQPGHTYDLVLWKIVAPGASVSCVERFENACLLANKLFTR